MKLFVLACLLPLVAGVVWLLAEDVPPPEAAAPRDRRVPTMVAVDSSGNGHDGIIQGPVALGLPGHDGSAYSFGRRGSWVQVAPSPELNPDDRDFLVTAWVSLAESPGPSETYDVIRKGVAYTRPGEFNLEVLPQGAVRCSAKDSGSQLADVTNAQVPVTDGAWHRIGCARTGMWWSVLVDDTVNSSRAGLDQVGNSVPLSIGSKYGLEDRPDGRVDDVRIIIAPDPVVSVSGEQDVAAAIEALEQQPPTAWWRLDEATSSVAGR